MPAELLIRPSLNDHEVVSDLLAPGGSAIQLGPRRSIISRLVIDATTAARRSQFADAAEASGVPLWIDPTTPLLQGEIREEDAWAKLPFGRAEEATPADFASHANRDAFIEDVVAFQVEHRASAVVAPYPFATESGDRWFELGLDWIMRTADVMDRNGIRVPLVAVFCGGLMKFGNDAAWDDGLRRFVRVAVEADVQHIAVCLSPAGNGKDSYRKLMRLLVAMERVRTESRLPVFAWRQGVYGPALIAAGIDGYETGMGTSEQSNVRSNITSRKPPKPGQSPGGGGPKGIYFEPLGRSIKLSTAQLLLANMGMRARVICGDERCCPHGPTSMLDHSAAHAVRSRARELALLDALPARSWRLNHIASKAHAASTLADQANRLLAEVGESSQIHKGGYDNLARVAEELRRGDAEARTA